MATLFNTRISDTYEGLIKTIDNAAISASLKELSDGSGNLTGLFLNSAGDFKVTNILEFGTLKDSNNVGILTFITAANGIENFDNDISVPTTAAVKLYVDTKFATTDTLAEVLVFGNTTSGTDIEISAGDDIKISDSSKLLFGNGFTDFEIYHDGTGSFISDLGAGNLEVRSNLIKILGANDESMILAQQDNGVRLFNNNSKKFETTSVGATVTGSLTVTNKIFGVLDTTVTGVTQAVQNGSTLIATTLYADSANLVQINANTTNINNNDTDIATNATNIATNVSGIATNVTNIGINEANISSNDTDIANNTSNISTNAANIATNVTNIATNATDIANIDTSGIAVNAANIATNTTNIATNVTNIATNVTNIDNNTQDIAENETSIAAKLPLAGGVLTGNVRFNDNVRANFGNGDDLSIFHNGNGNLITGNSNLYLQTSGLFNVETPSEVDMIKAVAGGGVDLFHAGVSVLNTENQGVRIGGQIAQLEISKGVNNARIVNPTDNFLIQQTQGSVQINKGLTENMAEFVVNGEVNLYHNGSRKLQTAINGVEVWGDDTAIPYLTIENKSTGNEVEGNVFGGLAVLSSKLPNPGIKAQAQFITGKSRTNYLGTAFQVNVNQSGTVSEAFRVNVGGDVGIGTPQPQSKLHISDINAELRLEDTQPNTGAGFARVFTGAENTLKLGAGSSGTTMVEVAGDARNISFFGDILIDNGDTGSNDSNYKYRIAPSSRGGNNPDLLFTKDSPNFGIKQTYMKVEGLAGLVPSVEFPTDVTIKGDDLEIKGINPSNYGTQGLILESPNGTRYKIKVANDGTLTSTAL